MHDRIPSTIESQQFDLLVIGAGINGAAIARDASLRGLLVVLVEQDDIASGTTSWSSRLIHGGFRYLEHRELRLVSESVRERDRLLVHAPHLVRPLEMAIPVFSGGWRGLRTIRAGLTLYDLFARDGHMPRHQAHGRNDTIARTPTIDFSTLQGSVSFYDAQCEYPERLTVELVQSAVAAGTVLLTHVSAGQIRQHGHGYLIGLTDRLSETRFSISATVVVNAAGPWVDRVLQAGLSPAPLSLLGGTRGSHLVLGPFAGAPTTALYFEARANQRPLFLTPWCGNYLLGTTDVRDDGNPSLTRTEPWEIDYLLTELHTLLPGTNVTGSDICYAYSGIRPLPYSSGDEGAVSRKHFLRQHNPVWPGVFSVVGGKLTTNRSLAEEAVDTVSDYLGRKTTPSTADLDLPGSTGYSTGTEDSLAHIYGGQAKAINDRAQTLTEAPLEQRVTVAEAEHALANEFPVTLTDLLMRRMMVLWRPDQETGRVQTATRAMAGSRGWTPAETAKQVAEFEAAVARLQPPIAEPTATSPGPESATPSR